MALTVMLSITFRSCPPKVNGIAEMGGHDPTLSRIEPLVPIVTLMSAKRPSEYNSFLIAVTRTLIWPILTPMDIPANAFKTSNRRGTRVVHRPIDSGPADRPIEPELGSVVAQDGVKIIGASLGQGLDRLQDFDGAGRSGQFRALADVGEVELQGIECFGHGFARLLDLEGSRLAELVRGDHVGRDLGLGLEQLEVRGLMFGPAAMHDGDIAEAEVLEFPEQAGRDVDSRSEVAEESVAAAAESRPPRWSSPGSG